MFNCVSVFILVSYTLVTAKRICNVQCSVTVTDLIISKPLVPCILGYSFKNPYNLGT